MSEVVTNALRHGVSGPADEIVIRLDADTCVHVEVEDPSPTFEPRRASSTVRPGGWGLYLLDAIADAWGVDEIDGSGKRVWFELDPERDD